MLPTIKEPEENLGKAFDAFFRASARGWHEAWYVDDDNNFVVTIRRYYPYVRLVETGSTLAGTVEELMKRVAAYEEFSAKERIKKEGKRSVKSDYDREQAMKSSDHDSAITEIKEHAQGEERERREEWEQRVINSIPGESTRSLCKRYRCRVAKLEKLLKQLEWGGDTSYHSNCLDSDYVLQCCPMCGGIKRTPLAETIVVESYVFGHNSDCALNAALEGASDE